MKRFSSVMLFLTILMYGQVSMAVDCNTDCNKKHKYRPDLRLTCHAAKKALNCNGESNDCRLSELADPGNYALTKEVYSKALQKGIIKNKSDCDKLANGHAELAKMVCDKIRKGPWCYAGSALTRKQGLCVCKVLKY